MYAQISDVRTAFGVPSELIDDTELGKLLEQSHVLFLFKVTTWEYEEVTSWVEEGLTWFTVEPVIADINFDKVIDANDVKIHCFNKEEYSWSTVNVLDVIAQRGLVKAERRPTSNETFYVEYRRYPFGVVPDWDLCKETVVAICGYLLFRREYALMPSTVRIGGYTFGFGASGKKLRDIINIFFEQVRAVTREFRIEEKRGRFGEGML